MGSLRLDAEPELNIGDMILIGKFKNKKAIVKDFGIGDHNQPVIKTDKGTINKYNFRFTTSTE